MKSFFKTVLATIVGIVVVLLIVVALGVASLVGLLTAESSTTSVKEQSVLVLPLSGTISSTSSDNPLSTLIGGASSSLGLNDLLAAIDKASMNDKIAGIYLEAGYLTAGLSTLRELRQALEAFKETGKWIIAYGDTYSQGAYYVASVADKVLLNPQGTVHLYGVASQVMYVKDLYAKLGIHFQIIKVGAYKSATEAYSEEQMSAANREQLTALTSGLWDELRLSLAASRRLSADSINRLADRFTAFLAPEEMVACGLVDSLVYSNDVKALVRQQLGIGADKAIAQLSVADMRSVKGRAARGATVAVYYAEGDIMDDAVGGLPSMGTTGIVAKKVCKDLDALAADDEVKAVVLRVNSPGGSAYASEQICHSVEQLKEKKPVVVSMGDYAASGGYYISCHASWIVAQPTTITGSIGIYGIIPDASELLTEKLALHLDGVQTNEHSDLASSLLSLATRPLDAYESELLQKYIDRGYATFCQRVADGRGLSREQVEAVAQGHVWLGSAALDHQLVDALGGIDDAISKAAALAELTTYHAVEYPEPDSWLDMLLNSDDDGNNLEVRLRQAFGEWYAPLVSLALVAGKQDPLQARIPYILNIY